ncbi:hypothetical protein CRM22_006657 [Opisthorchis felineus]|uniref:Uncharacterized protein n=1 Tax=Opisthorchis felineus TaxID=147828 RepID=A0A4S2LK37_OPIFE|nr:hypothetical protein CRM22_006657 [Opisthorchis felineus]
MMSRHYVLHVVGIVQFRRRIILSCYSNEKGVRTLPGYDYHLILPTTSSGTWEISPGKGFPYFKNYRRTLLRRSSKWYLAGPHVRPRLYTQIELVNVAPNISVRTLS